MDIGRYKGVSSQKCKAQQRATKKKSNKEEPQKRATDKEKFSYFASQICALEQWRKTDIV